MASELLESRHFLVTIAKRVMVDGFRRGSVEDAYLQVLAEQPAGCAVSPQQRRLHLLRITRQGRPPRGDQPADEPGV